MDGSIYYILNDHYELSFRSSRQNCPLTVDLRSKDEFGNYVLYQQNDVDLQTDG